MLSIASYSRKDLSFPKVVYLIMKTSTVMPVPKLSTRRFTKKSKSGNRNRKLTLKANKSLLNQTNQAKATVRVKVREILTKRERGGTGTGSGGQQGEDEEDSQGSGAGSSVDDFIEEKYGKLVGEVEQQKSEEGKELSESETERKLEELRVDVVQSEMRARARGYGSGGSEFTSDLKGYVEDKVDWRDRLLNLCQDAIASDFTWNYPNRRHIAEGMYLPSEDKDQLNTLVIGVDQSSSVLDIYVSLFEGAIKNIVGQVGFEKIYILYYTGILQEVVELDSGDNFSMKPSRYYGGTNFDVVTDWIEQEGITPSCLLMLTDGECRVPLEPSYPVGWCLTPNYDEYWIHTFGLDRYGEIIKLEM
jgi:hypothetical protein